MQFNITLRLVVQGPFLFFPVDLKCFNIFGQTLTSLVIPNYTKPKVSISTPFFFILNLRAKENSYKSTRELLN